MERVSDLIHPGEVWSKRIHLELGSDKGYGSHALDPILNHHALDPTKFTLLQEFQRTVLPDLAIWLLLSNFNVFELKIIVENDNCSSKIIFQMEKTFFNHVSMI